MAYKKSQCFWEPDHPKEKNVFHINGDISVDYRDNNTIYEK